MRYCLSNVISFAVHIQTEPRILEHVDNYLNKIGPYLTKLGVFFAHCLQMCLKNWSYTQPPSALSEKKVCLGTFHNGLLHSQKRNVLLTIIIISTIKK